MSYLTKQEIFDKVAAHLLTQMKKSRVNGKCVYRGANGIKCAIGALIPDSAYDPRIEDMAVCNINAGLHFFEESTERINLFKSALEAGGIDTGNKEIVEFCNTLQTIHDYNEPAVWRTELEIFAHRQILDSYILENY